MLIATMHDALPVVGYTVLIAAAAAALVWGGWALVRARRLVWLGVVLLVASVPVWAITLLGALFALAIGDCPPDAYECPF